MSRQMNPGIFGEVTNPFEASKVLEPLPLFESTYSGGPSNEELMDALNKAKYQNEEWVKSVNLRTDKTTQKVGQIEERLKQIVHEIQDRLAFVTGRLKEKQISESKIESLLERHNQIVQNFELRLSQAQRVIENQSLQLSKQQEMIDDAKRHIEKLKRL